jgi:hypothetical protein
MVNIIKGREDPSGWLPAPGPKPGAERPAPFNTTRARTWGAFLFVGVVIMKNVKGH